MSAIAQSGEPRTIVVPGTGSNSLTFTIPPGITLSVESVLAQVDASGAGGPVTATLSVLEQSGVVIANKRQGETIDAGAPGSATWALRLADEQAAAIPVSGGTETFNDAGGVLAAPNVQVTLPWVHTSGPSLLGLGTPTIPVVAAAGMYAVSIEVIALSVFVGAYQLAMFYVDIVSAHGQSFSSSAPGGAGLPSTPGATFSVTKGYRALDSFRVRAIHQAGGNVTVALRATVAQVA